MSNKKTEMRRIQIRTFLDEWMVGIVALLLVFGILGGWVAYQTHLDPGTVVEEETVATWDEESTVSHQATAERSNPVFEQNQTLTDQPHYFTQVSPNLGGEYTYRYSATDGGGLDAQLTATLQIQAVDEEGTPYWQRVEPLNQSEVSGLDPGEGATVPFAFNVSAAVEEVERIESTLGATVGSPQMTVVFDTHVTGAVNDEQVSETHQEQLLVDPDGGIYHVEPTEGIQQTHDQTHMVETTATYGPLRSYGSIALVLLALGGLVGCLALRYRGTISPTEAELATLEHQQERAEFEEWISQGRVPREALSGPGIEVDSLADLVDVAIDTNSRVIEDSHRGAFIVADDSWYYTTLSDGTGRTEYQLLFENGSNGHTELTDDAKPNGQNESGEGSEESEADELTNSSE